MLNLLDIYVNFFTNFTGKEIEYIIKILFTLRLRGGCMKELKNILIVEDDPDNQELLQEIISYSNPDCNYTSVNDGEEALKAAHASNFDLVLMDMSVPKKNGYEIINELRKTQNYQTVPMVALTAHAMKGVREKVLASGFDEYLAKPCTPKDIIGVIKKYLENKQKTLLS